MSGAKRYTVTRHATVFDVTDARGVASCVLASDAARIARLLNSEAEVRAALREAFACFGPADAPEVEAFWEGEYEDAVSRERQPDSKEVRARVLARVRAALSALGEE